MQSLRDFLASIPARRRRWLGGGAAAVVALFAVVIVLSALGPDEPPPSTASTTTTTTTRPSTTTSTTVPPSTTTAAVALDAWPLTGLPIQEGALRDPLLAVKIGNSPAARPQEGLDLADLVFDIPVEGGISRLLALYQSRLPETVGPVRSVREVDPKLLLPFGALVAHSGGNEAVVATLRESAVDVGSPVLGTAAYRRAGDRPAPYDLMLDPAAAVDSITEDIGTGGPWLLHRAGATGDDARTVTIRSSSRHEVVYGYSASDGGYLRFHGSQPHLAGSGGQIVAANVIVVVVEQSSTGRFDAAGAPVPDFAVLGSGSAVVFREGVAVTGRWERGRLIDFFRFLDDAGAEIGLATGSTWIHLVPKDGSYEWK